MSIQELLTSSDLCISWAASKCPNLDEPRKVGQFLRKAQGPSWFPLVDPDIPDQIGTIQEDEELYEKPLRGGLRQEILTPLAKLWAPLKFKSDGYSWWSCLFRLYLLRGLAEWTIDTFGDKVLSISAIDTIAFWCDLPDDRLLKMTKVTLASPVAELISDLPIPWPWPETRRVIWPVHGAWFKFVRTRLHGCTKPNVASLYSLLMVKKACFKAPPSFIIKTMVDHSKALSEESADLWSLHEEARVGLAPGNFPAKQLEHIRSVFARLWKGINISMLEKGGNLLLYEPSSGACLQETRSTGGQAEWVSGRMLQDDEYLRQGEMYLPRTGRVYSFKNPLASLNGMVEVAPGVVH